MKKVFICLSLFLSFSAFAGSSSDGAMYGWDILCRGINGLQVSAYQSDDDFYIDYQGGKLAKTSVWADAMDDMDSRYKTLLFMTDQRVSKGPEASLAVVRNTTRGEGYGTGVLLLEGVRYDLNCYIRYGVGEDGFDAIINKPFPPIAAPKPLTFP